MDDQPRSCLCCAIVLVLTSLMCSSSSYLVNAQHMDYPIATVSTSWTINDPAPVLEASNFDGNLTLADSDGTSVRSTYTGGGNYSVSGLNLTEDGNLVLLIETMQWFGSLSITQLTPYLLPRKIPVASSSSPQFIRLNPDGHLKADEWRGYNWTAVADLMTSDIDNCSYPMVCGNYGICSSNGQCSCLRQQYFQANKLWATQPWMFPYYTHFFFYEYLDEKLALEDCKTSCLKNYSCKLALFVHTSANDSKQGCLLLSQVFSLISNKGTTYENVAVFLKVQNPIPSAINSPQKKSGQVKIILGSNLGAFFVVFFVVASCIFYFKKKQESEDFDEFFVDQVPGIPTRFSYEELRAMTSYFNDKLGEGGFGSVFQGTLSNGTKVAVKRLNGFGQVKKSFLAEVETIGSIHHANLVRLIGFCAKKSYRLLVYEYMSNGSLDTWIFQRHQELTLGWQSRRNIILDIAKGLTYLHEECRQKIFHLDIKPQNILLDEYFNAKISDFG
ncbi:hypothetical protein ACSBR2_027252 [Camellia fascicularis]